MKTPRITLTLLLISSLFMVFPSLPPTSACGGSGNSVCVVTNTSCLKTMVLAKATPFVIVLPTTVPFTFNAPVNLFIACPTQNNCGQPCANAATPTSASITVALFDTIGAPPPPIAIGTISTSAGTMTLPACTAAGEFNGYTVPVTITVPGVPFGLYFVVGSATVTFSDGTTLTATGDTVVCLVEESPNQPGLPRLDVQLLTPNFPRVAPGDQHTAMYRVTNRDDNQSLTLTAFATNKQIALRPRGGNEKQGVYSLSHPFGDDFPIFFDAPSCIPLPDHPYTQGEINKSLPTLMPGESTTINLGIRSFGQCGSGSCSESTLRVLGAFSGEPTNSAESCAGMAYYVDTSVPTTGCGMGVNDCNRNGVPDALDLSSQTSQDQNFNALPDECEMNAVRIPNPVQVTPSVVTIETELIALSLTSVSPVPVTNVWANGIPLQSSDGGQTWTGMIPSDPMLGPQTVYALAKDSNGTLATHIGVYCRGVPFNDVSQSHLFYTEIGKISCRRITLGCGGGNYCPDQMVTREQMAAFIMRALGEFNPPTPAMQRFNDVPPSNPFYAFIDRLAARGITLGCSANPPLYCPGDPVTREQMAAFIMRALGEFNPPTPAMQRFNDVPPSNPFYAFIDRMAVRGITLGCSASPPLYCPGQPANRGQMAAFLSRAFNL